MWQFDYFNTVPIIHVNILLILRILISNNLASLHDPQPDMPHHSSEDLVWILVEAVKQSQPELTTNQSKLTRKKESHLLPHLLLCLILQHIPSPHSITLRPGEESCATCSKARVTTGVLVQVEGGVEHLILAQGIVPGVRDIGVTWALKYPRISDALFIVEYLTDKLPSNPFCSLSTMMYPKIYAVCMSILSNMSIMCIRTFWVLLLKVTLPAVNQFQLTE